MIKKTLSLPNMLTALQAMTALLCAIGTAAAIYLLRFGIGAIVGSVTEGPLLAPGIFGTAVVLIVSTCCLCALISFIGLCGRMKHATAFTAKNERAVKRIAFSCGGAGIVCAVGPFAFMAMMRRALRLAPNASYGSIALRGMEQVTLPYVWVWLLAFLLVSVGVICWAVSLLMRRASELQDESDYTV